MICSYFACRNAGIKFRYCSHCKVPVAKRNFRKRHKHGGEIVGDKGDDSGDDETPKKGIPSQITASRDEEEDEDGISSQSADSTNQGGLESKKAPVVNSTFARNPMITPAAAKPKEIDHGIVASSSRKVNDERLSRWVDLLAKRPSTKDSDTMSTWLMEVLAVSDLETPLLEPAPKSFVVDNHRDESDGMKVVKEEDISNEKDPKEKEPSVHVAADMNGATLEKKRPSELLSVEESNETKEESDGGGSGTSMERELTSAFASGSFAEWKARKKQKMESKGSSAPVV